MTAKNPMKKYSKTSNDVPGIAGLRTMMSAGKRRRFGKWAYNPQRRKSKIQYLKDGRPKGNMKGSEESALFALDVMKALYGDYIGRKDEHGRVFKSYLFKQHLPNYVGEYLRFKLNSEFDTYLRGFPCAYMWVADYNKDLGLCTFYYWVITKYEMPFDYMDEGFATFRSSAFMEHQYLYILFDPYRDGTIEGLRRAISTWEDYPYNERMWVCRGYHWRFKPHTLDARMNIIRSCEKSMNKDIKKIRPFQYRKSLALPRDEYMWCIINGGPTRYWRYEVGAKDRAKLFWSMYREYVRKALALKDISDETVRIKKLEELSMEYGYGDSLPKNGLYFPPTRLTMQHLKENLDKVLLGVTLMTMHPDKRDALDKNWKDTIAWTRQYIKKHRRWADEELRSLYNGHTLKIFDGAYRDRKELEEGLFL